MAKSMKRVAALLVALACFCAGAARAGLQELVSAGKVSWAGSPTVIYLKDGVVSDETDYNNLVLKYTDTQTPGSLTIGEGMRANARILVVGGGGAGGTSTSTTGGAGGGGGAGGYLETTTALDAGTFAIAVGAGGEAATSTDVPAEGGDGDNSSFGSALVAHGGGGGGGMTLGRPGGSGGGGSAYYDTAKVNKEGGASSATGDEQGYAGGKGSVAGYGGGGGGAGELGQDSSSAKSRGGSGLACDITGEEIYYAGGGGGGRTKLTAAGIVGGMGGGGTGGSTTAGALAGTAGLGGGGGGGGTTAPGGAGGSGVVIVRITQLVETQVAVPAIDDLVYNGASQAALDFGIAYTYVDGVTNATTVGEYTFRVQPGPDLEWLGGGTDVRAVTWKIVARKIEKPVVAEGLVYGETNQVGVVFTDEALKYCELSEGSVTNAVNAGTYPFVATLNDAENTTWADGTTAAINGSWTIAPVKVARPVPGENFTYDGTEKSLFAAFDDTRYEVSDGTIRETAGGDYTFAISLLGNETATNYVWDVEPATAEPYEGTWAIAAAENEITALSLTGWRVGTTPNAPTIGAKWGADTVVYSYGFGENAADITEWLTDATAIALDGVWTVRATIPGKPSWAGAERTATFVMWSDPRTLFKDHVDIAVGARAGATETLADFPALVRVSERRQNGFLYSRVKPDGSDLVFIDADGNLLSHEIDTWNVNGESLVWVKIPSLPPEGTTITMYWCLKEGGTVPAIDASDVWSAYIGVWHMNEANGNAHDATGHGLDGVPHSAQTASMIGVSGKIGLARRNSATAVKNNGNGPGLLVDSYNGYVADQSKLSVGGWFYALSMAGYPRPFSRKRSYDNTTGWEVQFDNGSLVQGTMRGSNGGNAVSFTAPEMTTAGWVHLLFVYDGTTGRVYTNGVLSAQGTVATVVSSTEKMCIGNNAALTEQAWCGYYDECRLFNGVQSAERAAAEYATVADEDFAVQSSPVSRDGVKLNYWLEVPAMDKTTWDAQDAPGAFTSEGSLAFGGVTNVIYSVYDPSRTFASPADIDEAGFYRALFLPTETEGYAPISYTIDIRVLSSKPYTKIGGTNGDSGRVLLMNRDTNTKCPVDYQGYSDTRSTLNTYWELLNMDGAGLPFNVQPCTECKLMTKGGERVLWHLVDCRHGNTYPTGATDPLSANQNYLPFSSTSKSFKSRVGAARQNTAGQVVMRNMVGAAVYSSCFEDGIGTIYFDAVNGWCRNNEAYENYRLVVEICTNTVEGLLPTDINSYTVTVTTNVVDDLEEITTTTNWYGNLEGQWVPVAMTPFRRDGTAEFVKTNDTEELTLDIRTGGTAENFFRVAAKVDVRGPVRFRIRRTASDGEWPADNSSFILLDNIIASVPAMGGDLVSAGRLDEEKTGGRVLGWELATSVPYPSAADEAVYGRATPEYYVNAGDGSAVDTDAFFAGATLHYRWRYLNQEVSEWAQVDLNPNDGFRAIAPFELPGRACDVEYWYEYTLQAPFYEYVDYSGAANAAIDYTEERGTLTNRLGAASQPSAGTDWFFRVREGLSAYSGLDIVYRRAGSGKVERAHMSLVGNHSWRGFIRTKEDQTGEVSYRIEALDRQTEEYADYAASTNYWTCATENPAFPVSDSVDQDGTADSWSTLALDAVTGYVMFQVDDTSRSLTVVHADYQDFNGWSDALNRTDSLKRGPIFVGTSTTNEYKVGVSPTKQTFTEDFSDWRTMPATNEYWSFVTGLADVQSHHMYGRPAYEPFSSDTNGLWTVGPGMWVSKKYKNDKDNSGVAFQMEGNGKGYLQFTDAAAAPRGLESITFNARLGQFIKFEDFAYYYGDVIMNLSNYTFMARTAFDLQKNKGFSGNASLSLVANYLPNKGCYEARWEWIGTELAKNPGGNKGQRLCLYRWTVNPSGTKTATLLSAWTNTIFNVAEQTELANNANQKFMPFFISVSNEVNTTWVIAGVRRTAVQLGDSPIPASTGDNDSWCGISFRDNAASRLKKGSYGVLSANCDGYFARPVFSYTVVGPNDDLHPDPGKVQTFYKQRLPLHALENVENCASRDGLGTEDAAWNLIPGRMTSVNSSTTVNAINSAPVAQDLQIYLGTAGRADWGSTPVTNIALRSFGTDAGGGQFTVPLYSTKDCSVRFAVAGSIDDVRTDVVIDSVALRQWRGGDWNSDGVLGVSQYLPDWAAPDRRADVNGYSNFVFTSCWIVDNMVLMSAKRSNLETPCAIRAPLMDGYKRDGKGGDGTSRGKGLGMISVGYKNAQQNVVLQLQIATNGVDYTMIDGYDLSFSDAVWTTVTNFTFSTMTVSQRASGVLNAYVGLHDVPGAMRILMSTNVVAAAANTTDKTKFGEIYITDVVCRDEPAVDVHSWWGWNMRTVGGDADTERKMLLSDYAATTGDAGLSAALNNSVDANFSVSRIDVADRESYLPHKPFIQTPTFTSNVVGEVSFKARKYAASDPDATVVVFGSTDASETDDGTWKKLDGGVFTVSNAYYETYSYKTDPGQAYKAFRLAVVGVAGVQEAASGGGNSLPPGVDRAERVLLDEVYVSEAVRARMGFRNVGCFKSDMSGTAEVPNVPSPLEQPLCEEAWGVQCEIYGAQLPDDIDFSRKPRVRLHWYDQGGGSVTGGVKPWGYERWKDLPGHKSAWLSQATGGEEGRYVYRSSQRTSPEAVVGMSMGAPTVVQYTLEVVYYTKGSTVATTNWLSGADWKVPDWYRPLDYNASLGGSGAFAAYNILDTVAPGWAWINEVNVFGLFDDSLQNSDATCQFVEVAQPPEADLSGWSLRFLEAQMGNDLIVTNTLAEFGMRDLEGKKDAQWIDPEANMVFRVIANRQARTTGRLKYEDGTLDGVWQLETPNLTNMSGDSTGDTEIVATRPFALQLVRASGIVEHEIVAMGTNWWWDLPTYLAAYHPTNTVNFLNANMAGARFFYVGVDDDGGEPNSLGVFQGNGSTTNDWNRTMAKTPGRRNEGQSIDPDHPVPSGEDILVYLTVSGGHIGQWDGATFTNAMQLVSVKKGSARGTNVLYRVDPWYVVGSATTNGVSATGSLARTNAKQPYEYELSDVGRGASNNVVVVATAAPNPMFADEFGVGEDNPYREAIVDWLEGGTDLYGNPFANVEDGEIRLAKYRQWNGLFVRDLTLTEMYWLDMDPTAGDLALRGGMGDVTPVPVEPAGGEAYENVRVDVYLMITNESPAAEAPATRRGVNDFGTHWTPYALRGVEPKSSSLGYDDSAGDWPSVTFKVTGRLLNGYTQETNMVNNAPLRLFVFQPDSFTAEGLTRVEIENPSAYKPFVDWWNEHGPCAIGYSWSIDARKRPLGVEVLQQVNYYEQ